jgi:hypothetical protein
MFGEFKAWRKWFARQPWSYKWFLWLVLLRPIIDVFWFVKESSLFSPLQLAGLLTFFFSTVYAFKLSGQRKNQTPLAFNLFAGLLFVNLLLVTFDVWSMNGAIRFIRFITPIVLFVYLVKVIHHETRLLGLLFTFLVSSIFPLSFLYYETFFDPITQVELSESRGGGFRLTGLYADLFNYMSYVIGDFLILCYFFIRSLKNRVKPVGMATIVVVITLAIIGIAGLKHQASWVVFFFIFGSVILSGFASQRVKKYVLLIGFPILLIAPVAVLPLLEKLFAKELKAYTGEEDSDRILNGRLIRWERYFGIWTDVSFGSKMLGVGFADIPRQEKNGMTGGGMHSDYVRFLFASGIIGLASFIMFYVRVYLGRKNFRPPEKFLISTSVGIMCLYSVSSNPFGGSGSLMFVVFSGMALSMNNARKFYPMEAVSPAGSNTETE